MKIFTNDLGLINWIWLSFVSSVLGGVVILNR